MKYHIYENKKKTLNFIHNRPLLYKSLNFLFFLMYAYFSYTYLMNTLVDALGNMLMNSFSYSLIKIESLIILHYYCNIVI